jgi:hypothetical protein
LILDESKATKMPRLRRWKLGVPVLLLPDIGLGFSQFQSHANPASVTVDDRHQPMIDTSR